MKHLLYIIIVLLPFLAPAQPRPLQQFVDSVMAHSPRIHTLQARMEADEAAAHAENRLADPSVSFRYMWGSEYVEDEKDLIVAQTFDFPTAYLHRSKIKRQEIRNAQLQYRAACHDVLLQATQLAVELCYNDTLLHLVRQQDAMSEDFLSAESTLFEEGISSVHRYNESQRLNLVHHQRIRTLEAERSALLTEFKTVCGFDYHPEVIVGNIDHFKQELLLPKEPDFDQWWQEVAASSPEMQLVDNAVNLAQLDVKTAKDGWLPQFTVGYEQEIALDEKLRGISVGLSLPLWSNGGKVKAARRALEAAKLDAQDQRLSFYTRLHSLYLKAFGELSSASEYRSLLYQQKNADLLRRTYEEGQITRPDYLEGMIGVLEVQLDLLNQEKSAALLWLQLNSVRY